MVPNWSLQSNNLCQSITLGHSKGKSLLCASCLLFHLSTTDMTLRCWCSSAAFTTWPGHWGSLGITNWWLDKPSPGRLGRIISELRNIGFVILWAVDMYRETTLALPCKYFCGISDSALDSAFCWCIGRKSSRFLMGPLPEFFFVASTGRITFRNVRPWKIYVHPLYFERFKHGSNMWFTHSKQCEALSEQATESKTARTGPRFEHILASCHRHIDSCSLSASSRVNMKRWQVGSPVLRSCMAFLDWLSYGHSGW